MGCGSCGLDRVASLGPARPGSPGPGREVDPAISFSMIDRLFGNTGEYKKISRDLTDIEQSVMEIIIAPTNLNI